MRKIFQVTGPVSRLLQGVAADLAVSAALLDQCIKSFQNMRDFPEAHWDEILEQAKSFAAANEIEATFKPVRIRRTKVMSGETTPDERIQNPEQSYKVKVFIHSVDVVLVQLKERFNTANKQLLTGMQVFTPLSLLSDVQEDDVRAVCDFYQLDATHLVRELSEFRTVYREVHHLIVVDDLQTKRGKTSVHAVMRTRTTMVKIEDIHVGSSIHS